MGIREYLAELTDIELRRIKYRYREQIVADIRNRMCSLLSRWDQEDFRRTVLFVTNEEALFYEPPAPDDVRRFVVATIRNSMLEVAASDDCGQFKMREPISDDEVKEITAGAIRYFSRCDFAFLQREAEALEFSDVYEAPIRKYPLAWAVLRRAAACDGVLEFEAIATEAAEGSEELEPMPIERSFTESVCNGYSPDFDDGLKQVLRNLSAEGDGVLYVDCFKMLTRNFEKLLHVLQILLQSGCAFATCNYYISNGYIEKRRRIMRAGHGMQDVRDHLRNRRGLSPRFEGLLQGLM